MNTVEHGPNDPSRDLLVQGARAVGWKPPEGSFEDVVRYCRGLVLHIQGGQDRTHAEHGLRAAIDAAQAGNAPYVTGGLFEVKKTLELHAHNW